MKNRFKVIIKSYLRVLKDKITTLAYDIMAFVVYSLVSNIYSELVSPLSSTIRVLLHFRYRTTFLKYYMLILHNIYFSLYYIIRNK